MAVRSEHMAASLERMWVVHAGKDTIKLAPKVTALPLAQVASTRLW